MKKFHLIASLVLGLTAATQAQILGMGWDNQAGEVVGRMGLGSYSTLEAGVGLRYDDSEDDDNVAEEERIFAALSAGGQVAQPLQDTFWGARFGMLTDKFGMHWMFNCELPK